MCLRVLGVTALHGEPEMRLSEGSATVTISSWLKGKRMQRGAAHKLRRSSWSLAVQRGRRHPYLSIWHLKTCVQREAPGNILRAPLPGTWAALTCPSMGPLRRGHAEQPAVRAHALARPRGVANCSWAVPEVWSFLSRHWMIWPRGNLHEGFAARGQSGFSIASPRRALNIRSALMWCPALPQTLLNLKEIS